MAFIGIVTNKSNKIELENKIKQKINGHTIISFKVNNVSNIKNIKFDTIIINYDVEYNDDIRNILEKAKNIVVNADLKHTSELLNNINSQVITYGFNPKATVTISSVNEGDILLDFQREIDNINNKKIENKEIKIQLTNGEKTLYEEVTSEILYLLYG